MKFSRLLSTAVFITIMSVAGAYAQLPVGSFGMGAAFFNTGATQAQFLYVPATNIQLDFGVGYQQNKIDLPGDAENPEATSQVMLNAGAKYFLNSNAVSPFIGVLGSYNIFPSSLVISGDTKTETDHNGFSLNLLFGAASAISKNVALAAQVGIGFGQTITKQKTTTTASTTEKESTATGLNFGGSAVGVAFYF